MVLAKIFGSKREDIRSCCQGIYIEGNEMSGMCNANSGNEIPTFRYGVSSTKRV
jgi:hypothetical protein